MYSTLEKMIIRRYLLPEAGTRLILFIAGIGVVAVALGVASLIVVLAAMNGAGSQVLGEISGLEGDATILITSANVDLQQVQRIVRQQQNVAKATPLVELSVMASANGRVSPSEVKGISPGNVRSFALFSGRDTSLVGRTPVAPREITIGSGLAGKLGVGIGSEVVLLVPSFRGDELAINQQPFLVTGIVQTSLQQSNETVAIMGLDDALGLTPGNFVNRVSLLLRNKDEADQTAMSLNDHLPNGEKAKTWKEMNESLFSALAVEKVAMIIGLLMCVLVAVFNIFSSLILLVRSKVSDIAILRTMGVSRGSILKIFLTIGTSIGATGSIFGCVTAFVVLSAKGFFYAAADDRMRGIIDATTFLRLPVKIGAVEVVTIVIMALLGSVLSSLYPALRASRVDPATALRHK